LKIVQFSKTLQARGTPPPLSTSPTKHDNDAVTMRRRGSAAGHDGSASDGGATKKPTVNRVAELQTSGGSNSSGGSTSGSGIVTGAATGGSGGNGSGGAGGGASTTTTANVAGARLSPIVSADTEALMRRLVAGVAASGGLGPHHAGGVGVGSVGSVGGGYFLNANSTPFSSSYNPSAYSSSPSFADLALTKTAESLAASNGVAVENCNGVIVYGEGNRTNINSR
jgi:hypothetical protein